MSKGRLFRIEGRVQGVWFRESTRQHAVRLGIAGHAINLPDGSVEVLACGNQAAVDELARWLQRGPPRARVERVSAGNFEGDCPPGFSIGWGEGGR